VDEKLLLSCFHTIEQGIIQIKEWQPPSTIDILKEMKSSSTLSDLPSNFLNYLINKEDNMDLDFVSDEFIINPCNDVISTCVVSHGSKDPIRPSKAEIIDPKFSSENIEAVSSASIWGGGQQLEDSCLFHDRLSSNRSESERLVLKTGASGSNFEQSNIGLDIRSENKSKPKMLKPKKPEIGV
jgi:hypothetical protein